MTSYRSNPSSLTHDEIALRAHRIWENRGRPSGYDDEIWLEAERQLLSEQVVSSSSLGASSSANSVDIDQDALAGRLDDFGDPGNRSVTSADRPT